MSCCRFTLLICGVFLCGCSGDSAAPESTATATSSSSRDRSSNGDPSGTSDFEDLLVGLDLPNLKNVFEGARDEWQQDQGNGRKTMRFADVMARVGQLHEEQGTSAQAAKAFRSAAEIISNARVKGIDIDPGLESIVIFHVACVEALEGKAEASLKTLERAVELGYSEMAKIRETPALESVRSLPEFASTMQRWEAARRDRILEQGRREIANGEAFPFTFDLVDVKGQPLRLGDLRGKVCVVDIWGTWCGPCVMEIPSFVSLQKEYGDKGFQMVGLNSERGSGEIAKAKVQDFMVTHQMNYPCALITEDVLGQVPQLEGYPTTLFIDRDGKVRARMVGVQPHDTLEGIVLALLEEPAGEQPKSE
ncbi:MAG: TlpA family protein disulfide reductase [Planctomycetota bacterium]